MQGLCIGTSLDPQGGRRDRTLYANTPPPPSPSLLDFGWEVPDHGRRMLDLVEGGKMGFHPMCLYSKYSVFSGEPNNG